MKEPWKIIEGDGPLLAAAIHDGHRLRDSLHPHVALDELGRLREEDPFTGEWTRVANTRIIGGRSRFEVDLNRPREKAVYRKPEDAWGLKTWKADLPQELVDESLALYDSFYGAVASLLEKKVKAYGRFVIFDLHTYNHRRDGPEGPVASEEANPEVNIGTGTMDRKYWAPVIDAFLEALRAFDYRGRRLDVRENVKFLGGNFGRWTHEKFPEKGCAISIEYKKFFMDEWSGKPNPGDVETIQTSLAATVPGVLKALQKFPR